MMNNTIPPPIVGLCVALLMWLINRVFGFVQLQSDVLKVLAIALVIVGLAIEIYSVFLFFKQRTTVNPLRPQNTKALVVSGMYRFTRNPMYLGMLLLLCGYALWLGNVLTLPCLALFVWFINRYQIQPEEQALSAIFGEQFEDYKRRVRRWI